MLILSPHINICFLSANETKEADGDGSADKTDAPGNSSAPKVK